MKKLFDIYLIKVSFVISLLIGWKFPIVYITSTALLAWDMYLNKAGNSEDAILVKEVAILKDAVTKLSLKAGFGR